uniref:Uncharacterized protein n=1 Tax=Kryptolebias marmoratus TaxID=37003 RepID=A0A3Q3F9N1_KRYMA
MEAIISAAETGFTGSLVGSTAYIGTITGFRLRLTMFLVSMPRQQRSALLQCEPPHWYLRPTASWTSCSCSHTAPNLSSLSAPGFAPPSAGSSRTFRDRTRSSTCCFSRRLDSNTCRNRRRQQLVNLVDPPLFIQVRAPPAGGQPKPLQWDRF